MDIMLRLLRLIWVLALKLTWNSLKSLNSGYYFFSGIYTENSYGTSNPYYPENPYREPGSYGGMNSAQETQLPTGDTQGWRE